MEIYESVIPKDNLLRQIKELVDFSFIYDELLDKYFLDMAPEDEVIKQPIPLSLDIRLLSP